MAEDKETRSVVLTNPEGLHLRAARLLVLRARDFKSQVEVIKDCQRADAKDMPLQLTALGAAEGDELLLEATGPDAAEALESLVELFVTNFEEEQTLNSRAVADRSGDNAADVDPSGG